MNLGTAPTRVTVNHGHIFCGIGGGAMGFNQGEARVGSMEARFQCLGGIDNNAAAIRDFDRLAGVKGALLDLFDRAQYEAFHGTAPPDTYREAVPDDIRRAFQYQHPHIIFLSAPCKGFSGLLSETLSRTDKYQALNRLTLRGVWLALEAYKDDPVELFVFENVPRIAKRGRSLLDRIVALLRSYGYAVAETTHDCGELGGLAQTRKRFLLVARHMEKVPPFLYEPVKRPLRAVGDVLGPLPLPGDPSAGPMHRMPALQWQTWLRLAFVEAGSDWRSLNRLKVEDGMLADYGIVPDAAWRRGVLGVRRWEDTSGTVAGETWPGNGAFSVADPRDGAYRHHGVYGVNPWGDPAGVVGGGRPSTGKYSVADPRIDGHPKSVQLGVRRWDETAGVVTGKMFVGGGPNAVADPRPPGKPRFNNVFRVVPFDGTSPAVAGPGGPAGGLAVADPRPAHRGDYKQVKYRVTRYDERAGSVIGASTTGTGAYAVADPRPYGDIVSEFKGMRVVDWKGKAGTITGQRSPGSSAQSVADPRPRCLNHPDRAGYMTQGHYGVVGWEETSGAVPAFAKNNNGAWSVADPRDLTFHPFDGIWEMPAARDQLVAVIIAPDGTWHRPFTTFELAALQGLIDASHFLELDGLSDSAWRERIGNLVPPPAAKAIAGEMGRTLLLAWSGETFQLNAAPIWVQPMVAGLMAATGGAA